MSNYYITPACRTLEADDYRTAQMLARRLHPAGKATPIVPTGVVADDRPNVGCKLDVNA